MIKCRQRAGGRGGRQRWRGKREGEGEAEKEAPTSSAASHPVTCQPLPGPSPPGPNLSEPTRSPESPTAATAIAPGLGPPRPNRVVTQVTCPCLQQANKSKKPETKNSCKRIALSPSILQETANLRVLHRGAVRPRPLQWSGCDCRCKSPQCRP